MNMNAVRRNDGATKSDSVASISIGANRKCTDGGGGTRDQIFLADGDGGERAALLVHIGERELDVDLLIAINKVGVVLLVVRGVSCFDDLVNDRLAGDKLGSVKINFGLQ